MPLSIGIFPEGSENGHILGPAFWCWRTTFELIFGIAQSGRGATISSATCSRRTPKCSSSQLMLALNTYSFQTIKLKLAAFLPSAAPTGEAPCGAHVFEGFFGLENGPVKSDKSQEKTLFGKDFPNPPRHSRRSVSDGVIQLRVPLAGCAGFFLQAPIPRRILTKMSGAICCMNMRFAKRSWEHPCF